MPVLGFAIRFSNNKDKILFGFASLFSYSLLEVSHDCLSPAGLCMCTKVKAECGPRYWMPDVPLWKAITRLLHDMSYPRRGEGATT